MKKSKNIFKDCMNCSFEKLHKEIALIFADRFGKQAREVYEIARYEKPRNIIKMILEIGIKLSADEQMMVRAISVAEGRHLKAKIKLVDVFFLDSYREEKNNGK